MVITKTSSKAINIQLQITTEVIESSLSQTTGLCSFIKPNGRLACHLCLYMTTSPRLSASRPPELRPHAHTGEPAPTSRQRASNMSRGKQSDTSASSQLVCCFKLSPIKAIRLSLLKPAVHVFAGQDEHPQQAARRPSCSRSGLNRNGPDVSDFPCREALEMFFQKPRKIYRSDKTCKLCGCHKTKLTPCSL